MITIGDSYGGGEELHDRQKEYWNEKRETIRKGEEDGIVVRRCSDQSFFFCSSKFYAWVFSLPLAWSMNIKMKC